MSIFTIRNLPAQPVYGNNWSPHISQKCPVFYRIAWNDHFPWMKSSKQPKKEPLQPLIIYALSFYHFTHTLFGETFILFGKTLYNLAKLPTFAKLYRVLPDCTGVLPNGFTFAKSYEVLPKGITYAKLYPTFAKSFILFGKRTPEQRFTLSRM